MIEPSPASDPRPADLASAPPAAPEWTPYDANRPVTQPHEFLPADAYGSAAVRVPISQEPTRGSRVAMGVFRAIFIAALIFILVVFVIVVVGFVQFGQGAIVP